MKIIISTALTAFLATGVLSVQAAGVDEKGLDQCKVQVADYYGVDDYKYVGQRRFRDGVQVKFAVQVQDTDTGYTATRLATCWLGNENMQASIGEGGGATIADVYDSITDSIVNPLDE